MQSLLEKFGIAVSAFNCSGNPLAPGDWGKREAAVTRKTFRLSELFGIKTVVMMSGLPSGGPEDKFPNWVVTSWPPETQVILDYQWNRVAIPYWRELVKVANRHGVTRLALEPHGCQLVHDVENFRRLRNETDETVGFNLDPSHLFWMGADPLLVARELGDAIYHVHVKDVRIEKPAGLNTLLDGKSVLEYAKRSWNFAIPGYGHDERWWREFLITLKMAGYDGVLSIEHEDHTMDTLAGLKKTVKLIEETMP
ncbi:MAG: sugar phosphate isomerase/epimerase [Planctomycetes bacterium]|nr:sugar phosphate isomerase/epimerase [Planctomycetota bacterium]